MVQVVDLDELLPEDITVRVRGTGYQLPGDMDVEQVFRLFELYLALSKIESDDPAAMFAEVKGRFGDINAELLDLFKIRQPDLEKLPFGIRGIGAMLRLVLEQLGLKITETDPPTPSPRPKRTTPKTRKPRAER